MQVAHAITQERLYCGDLRKKNRQGRDVIKDIGLLALMNIQVNRKRR